MSTVMHCKGESKRKTRDEDTRRKIKFSLFLFNFMYRNKLIFLCLRIVLFAVILKCVYDKNLESFFLIRSFATLKPFSRVQCESSDSRALRAYETLAPLSDIHEMPVNSR